MAEKKQWLDVGVICYSKKGNLQIKISNDVTLKEGDYLQLEKPLDGIERMNSFGVYKDEGEYEAQVAKYSEGGNCHWIKYRIKKAPSDD